MAVPRRLRKPPITEAIVDFRIVADAAITRERLEPICVALREQFPNIEEKRQFVAEFRVENGRLIPPSSKDLGFQAVWLTSQDRRRIAQFRTDGCTLNQVAEYTGGDELIESALALWTEYAAVIKPKAVTRLALRYLNQLNLPFRQGDEFEVFLVAPPELPEGAPQKVSDFLSRIVAHDDTGAHAIVTQKMQSGPMVPVPVVIDVDVFFDIEISPDVRELRPFLSLLRDLKNRCFFSLLTEEAVKLFQ